MLSTKRISYLTSLSILLVIFSTTGCHTGASGGTKTFQSAFQAPQTTISSKLAFLKLPKSWEATEPSIELSKDRDKTDREKTDRDFKIQKTTYLQDPSDPDNDTTQQVEIPSTDTDVNSLDDETPLSEEKNDEAASEDSIVQLAPDPDAERKMGQGIADEGPNEFALTLPQVLTSVRDCYPEIRIAMAEIETAKGKAFATLGSFDQMLSAHSISQPLGFYQTYRNGVGINQPLFSGGEVYSTYRIGDGNFEPWFGERETNEGGEFKAGFDLPFLKNRAIDARRAKRFAALFQQEQVESNVNFRLLLFQRFATQAYWDWVASGMAVKIQERLLELAETRVDQIEELVEAGDQAGIAQIDNDRLIAKRKNDLIKANRLLEKTAIKLSLYWRNELCQPVIAPPTQLPRSFPDPVTISEEQLMSDISTALSMRPELVELQAQRKEACIDLSYARNLTLPKLDLKGFAGQDVGGAASSKGDKTPFELQVGLIAEVPIQRREGLGKIQAAEGKIAQIDSKIQFTSDKIRTEIQDAASAVTAAIAQIQQSRENLDLTRQALELGGVLFFEGDIDVIALNIYETAVADAELQVLDAQFKYFFYQAIYETAIRGTFTP